MRVLIAGGSGLIGGALTQVLVNQGDEVGILSRNPTKIKRSSAGVHLIQWDGKSIQAWVQEVKNFDAIVNLTGENISGTGFLPSRWTEERKQELVQSRVMAGKVLTQAIEMASTRPSIFVQASGIGYYGTRQTKPLSEGDQAGDDFLANLSKKWEASSQPVEAMGLRRVIIRNGVVLSTRGGALPFMLLPYKMWVGGPLGNGKQVYSWIHIADEANAISFLLHNNQAIGIYNLTSPNPVTNNEFGKAIGKVMGRPHYFPIPGIAMRLALGEVADTVLEGQRVLPNRLLEQGFSFKFPVLEDALRDLLK